MTYSKVRLGKILGSSHGGCGTGRNFEVLPGMVIRFLLIYTCEKRTQKSVTKKGQEKATLKCRAQKILRSFFEGCGN